MSIILTMLRIYVVSGAQGRMSGRRPGGSAESCGHLSSRKNLYVKNSGRPKGSNAYGLRDGVVAIAKPVSQVRLMSSTPSGLQELETLRMRNSLDTKLVNDKTLSTLVKCLREAYLIIKSKPGSSAKDAQGYTLDGISDAKIEKLGSDIISGRYQPCPSRRVEIPKRNGKTRFLGISGSTDRIVMQAMKMVLTEIYEPIFEKTATSYGFRPDKSCHAALNTVKMRYGHVN